MFKATREVREAFDMASFSGVNSKFPDDELPEFRKKAEAFKDEVLALCDRVFTAISLGLGQKPGRKWIMTKWQTLKGFLV